MRLPLFRTIYRSGLALLTACLAFAGVAVFLAQGLTAQDGVSRRTPFGGGPTTEAVDDVIEAALAFEGDSAAALPALLVDFVRPGLVVTIASDFSGTMAVGIEGYRTRSLMRSDGTLSSVRDRDPTTSSILQPTGAIRNRGDRSCRSTTAIVVMATCRFTATTGTTRKCACSVTTR